MSWYAHPSYKGTPPVVDAPPGVHMRPGMHTPRYEGTSPVVDAPPPVYMHPGMHSPRYEGTPPVVDAPPPVHTNAIKIGNPTSQCAVLGLKLVQLSTLAGRIFFFVMGEKVRMEWGRIIYRVYME